MDKQRAKALLVEVIRSLAAEKQEELDKLKANHADISRDDFVWHYLLHSFSTMGRASGRHGLIGNKVNYDRLRFEVLDSLKEKERDRQILQACRDSGIRMPELKARYISRCFLQVRALGGPKEARAKLLSRKGRDAKIAFLKGFYGIGDKYARNIMMDVYHEDFRDSVALDIRIKAISDLLGLAFPSYEEHEAFYLSVAQQAGANGWELDRILFNFKSDVERRLKTGHYRKCPKRGASARRACILKVRR